MSNWLRNIFAPSDRRVQKYLSDPYSYDKQILKLGGRAVPGLISTLDDARNGWGAASLLGRLGIRQAAIIDELRRRVTGESGVSNSSAIALARLGDIEFLMTMVQDKGKCQHAVHGITSLLKESSVLALDYGPVEKLLNSGSERVIEMLHEELGHGSAPIEIQSSDIDEALRGLTSKHVVIREHAVCVLGDRRLGSAAAKVVLPALVERLKDDNADVRRLALLSLAQWKSAAKPYHAAL